MDINQICDRVEDIHGEPFPDDLKSVIFIIAPRGDKIFCFTDRYCSER